MNLGEFIKSKRPNLSDSSVKTYLSILSNLLKKVYGTNEFSIDKLNDSTKILDFLKDYTPNRRKTILSALVITTELPEYRTLMMEDSNNYATQIATQVKTQKQQDNTITQDELQNLLKKHKNIATKIYKKEEFTAKDYQDIQDYILLALFSGVYIIPRRSLDYTSFKFHNIDKLVDNFMDGNELVFQKYKTAKSKGIQRIKIPTPLKNILKKWKKINPTDYLLFNNKQNPLTSATLTQKFNRLFGNRNISINNLRSSYLSHKYQDTIKTRENLENDMEQMGSSLNMSNTYIKR
mgnify:FL=1